MGPFESFYASPLQHPILLWLAAAAALVWCRSRSGLDPSVRRYCTLLVVLSLADAWLTSSHVYSVGALPTWARGPVPGFFVLAGDFRFLILFGAATSGGAIELPPRRLAAAAGLTVIVPIVSQVVLWVLSDAAGEIRVLYLVHELLFLVLTLALLRWHPGVKAVAWLAPVCRFVLIYYGLWASADVIILATGSDLGFLLRVVPNLLYYGGLIAAIGWAASRSDGST